MNPEDFYDSRPRWVSLHEIEFERFRDEVDRRTRPARRAIAFQTDLACEELSMSPEELEEQKRLEAKREWRHKQLMKLFKVKTKEDEQMMRLLAFVITDKDLVKLLKPKPKD
jgi:hypothetical protein